MNTKGSLLTAGEAADICRLSQSTLAHWRCRGHGPVWLKLGHSVRYSQGDLDHWLADRARPTDERGIEPTGGAHD